MKSLEAKYIKGGLDPLSAHFKAIETLSKLGRKPAVPLAQQAPLTKDQLEQKYIKQVSLFAPHYPQL